MRFVKMHGLGNDYVYVDCFEQDVTDPARLAVKISDRHFGVGSDGLILVCPDDDADCRMRMFNADGSEAQMCGNGIRCVAKYVYDHNRCRKNPLRVATGAGVKTIALQLAPDGTVAAATVDMGTPILQGRRIPTIFDAQRVVDERLTVDGRDWAVTCVSMGNPHAVVYVDDVAAVDLHRFGPAFERHEAFPERINVHFVKVHSSKEVTVVHWERGSGPTLACGTGAAAVCVAGVLTGRGGRHLTAHLPGGDATLQWRDDDHVFLTGPAVEVFSGEWTP
ncbi:MAG: diaminopimelate epimerase [Planctomycetes bacterium]|nr:diaminopimelate epimerase [Planctomycetota bacterium]